MKWVVKAEWISYDRTSIHNGKVATATEIDSTRPMADYTVDIFLVDAMTEEEAIAAVGTPWEVSPTVVRAYQPETRAMDKRVIHISTERSHYWRYKPQTRKERTSKLQARARQTLVDVGFDINEPVDLKALAPQLAEQTGCHVETAKRHLAKAARLLRGEHVATRGGKRPGAGRPSTE